ncbi:hypothetical protein [Catenuloplanes indicus]|uniref:Uncharacterized protein n=1 Tax=Catenuloplanes indicus TaxID=137267 RepID=A0AAE4AZZ4_9ACTN|nr:hypothetical protein [Catenuloplanes indicus]MDQ0366393.1 hypothetical protein [Catenuloplanes indicus]
MERATATDFEAGQALAFEAGQAFPAGQTFTAGEAFPAGPARTAGQAPAAGVMPDDAVPAQSAPMWEVPDRPGEQRAAIFGGPPPTPPPPAPSVTPPPIATAEFDPEADLEDRFRDAPRTNREAWRGIETPGSVSTLSKPEGSGIPPQESEPAFIDLGERPGSGEPRGLRAMLSGLVGRARSAKAPKSSKPPKHDRERPTAPGTPWTDHTLDGTNRSWPAAAAPHDTAPVTPATAPDSATDPRAAHSDDSRDALPADSRAGNGADQRDGGTAGRSNGAKQPWPSPIPQDGLSLLPPDDMTPHSAAGSGAATGLPDGGTAADNPESSGGTRSWGSPASWPSTPTPHAGAPGVPAPAPVTWPDAGVSDPAAPDAGLVPPAVATAPSAAPAGTTPQAAAPAGATPQAENEPDAGTTPTAFTGAAGPAAPAAGTGPARPVWNTAGSVEAAFVPVDATGPKAASEWFTHVEPKLSDPAAPVVPAWAEAPGSTGGLALADPAEASTRSGPAAAATPPRETPSQNGWAERPPVVDLWADADGTSWTTTPTAQHPATSPASTTSPQTSGTPGSGEFPQFGASPQGGTSPQQTALPQSGESTQTGVSSRPDAAPQLGGGPTPFEFAPPQATEVRTDPATEVRTDPATPETGAGPATQPTTTPAAAPGWDEPAPRDDPYAMYRRPATGADEPVWDTTPSWASSSPSPVDPDRGTREQPPLRSPDAAGPGWSGRAERLVDEAGRPSGAHDDRADGTLTTGRDQVPGRDRSQPAEQEAWSDVPAPPAHLATPPSPGPDRAAPPGRRFTDRRTASGDRRTADRNPAERGGRRPGRRDATPRHGAESDVRVLSTYTGDEQEKPRRRGLGIMVAVAVAAVAVAGGGLAALRGVPGLNLAAAGNGPHAISAPLDGREALTFDLVSGVTSVSVTSDDLDGDLYRISTPQDSGMRPEAIDQGDRLMLQMAETGQRGPSLVEVRLSAEVRWDVRLTGGATEHVIDFSDGRLSGFDVLGGATRLELDLPVPEKSVRLKVSSGISQFVLRTPADVPSRLRFGAGADSVTLLGDARGPVAPNSRFTPKAWEDADDRYDIAITGGVGTFTLER